MAKAKCPKKQKTVSTPIQETPISNEVIGTGKIKVVFNDNVQLGNELYKKGVVAKFDNIDGFKRYCTVLE